jgi:hypothetical protein
MVVSSWQRFMNLSKFFSLKTAAVRYLADVLASLISADWNLGPML